MRYTDELFWTRYQLSSAAAASQCEKDILKKEAPQFCENQGNEEINDKY